MLTKKDNYSDLGPADTLTEEEAAVLVAEQLNPGRHLQPLEDVPLTGQGVLPPKVPIGWRYIPLAWILYPRRLWALLGKRKVMFLRFYGGTAYRPNVCAPTMDMLGIIIRADDWVNAVRYLKETEKDYQKRQDQNARRVLKFEPGTRVLVYDDSSRRGKNKRGTVWRLDPTDKPPVLVDFDGYVMPVPVSRMRIVK